MVNNYSASSSMQANQQQQYKKPGWGMYLGGAFAGSMAGGLLHLPNNFISEKMILEIQKINTLSEDEFKKVSEGIENTLKDSGLAC